MRKVISLMHVSLDGMVAGPNGEMDWIKVDDELFDFVNEFTAKADIAIYGRKTYLMMEAYWPTAAAQPGASKHDVEHGNWANNVTKLVFSKTLKETNWQGSRIISDGIADEINSLKEQPGKDMLIFGSTTLTQEFIRQGLVDEFWIFLNPVLLGKGKLFFEHLNGTVNLEMVKSKNFSSGVVGLNYKMIRP